MKIIHGDNQSASREYFLELKSQNLAAHKQIIDLSGQGLTLAELQNKSASSSLLGDSNSLFISDFFTGRPGREKKLITEYLEEHQQADIFIWESKDVALQLKSFTPSLVIKYEIPKYVFQFLDHPSIQLLHKALASSAPEQILALLIGHMRKLIMAKNKVGNLPAWQMQKLNSQVSIINPSKLKQLYKGLLEIDYRQKTSQSVSGLPFSLELWVSRL